MSHSRTIHHETALVACQILACNKLGYLSTSRDRNAECVNVALDSIIPPNKYYYHLNTLQPDALYPICRNFEDWEFPHNAMPSSWQANVSSEHFWSSDWTTLSQRIKDRDRSCLVSGWKDSLTTAHVVNKEDGDWVCTLWSPSQTCCPNLLLLAR